MRRRLMAGLEGLDLNALADELKAWNSLLERCISVS
ncbi:protein of unknown function [Candidatus Filomicrobium marinum]|uniref:Uncharacterized protein n=1 Tax=Candidatus Filomicrobium marinum TaxID=1608628 RepID=A0A0D6JFB2_9HYPH|nr:protein of unknown function [Candidatus Filomicrobium marinum]CPR18680.1 protein of unknown function [Candidatus Filomicrobium marinum]